MLMISLLNASTSTAKCIQLCMFVPRATNSLLTITGKGGSVRVYSCFDLNLGEGAGLFSFCTSLDVQIHTDTAMAETMPLRYLTTRPEAEKARPAYKAVIPALTLPCWPICSTGDVLCRMLILLLLPLFSTCLHPQPSRCFWTQGGPPLFQSDEQCCCWLKWNPLIVIHVSYLGLSGYASDAGWPPHTDTQYCALTRGSASLYRLRINT